MSRSFATTAVVTLYTLGRYRISLLNWTNEATISHQLNSISSFNTVQSRLRGDRHRLLTVSCWSPLFRLGMNLYVRFLILWK